MTQLSEEKALVNDLEEKFSGPKNTAASKIFMQAVNKLSSYVSNKPFVMFPTVMNSLSVAVFSFSLICER